MFQLRVLPELAWKRALGPRWDKRLQRTEGIPADDVHTSITLTQDALAGLNMYRANLLPRLSHRPQPSPRPHRCSSWCR